MSTGRVLGAPRQSKPGKDRERSRSAPSVHPASADAKNDASGAVGKILRLQAAAGNVAVRRLLAPTSTPVFCVQRELHFSPQKWSASERSKFGGAFTELEELISALTGKPEANFKVFKEVLAIFNRYNEKLVTKTPDVLSDLNTAFNKLPTIRGYASKYGTASTTAGATGKEEASDDEGSEVEDELDLSVLIGGTSTGQKFLAEQAESAAVKESQAKAEKIAAAEAAYYSKFNKKSARAELTKWVRSEADRMVVEAQKKFASAPETYGSVLYSRPDAKLVAIAGSNSADLYLRIAFEIKKAFPEGSPSHILGYNYHHTKSKTKGAGGFNITGWLPSHDPSHQSPFNLHIVHS